MDDKAKRFTLIDGLFCGAIFLVCGALIFPKIMGRSCSACINPTKAEEATIASCLHEFRLDCGRYPTTEEGLQALVKTPSRLEGKAKEPYLTVESLPLDKWGNPFQYLANRDGSGFVITSFGRDGAPGGQGEDEDIVDSETDESPLTSPHH